MCHSSLSVEEQEKVRIVYVCRRRLTEQQNEQKTRLLLSDSVTTSTGLRLSTRRRSEVCHIHQHLRDGRHDRRDPLRYRLGQSEGDGLRHRIECPFTARVRLELVRSRETGVW